MIALIWGIDVIKFVNFILLTISKKTDSNIVDAMRLWYKELVPERSFGLLGTVNLISLATVRSGLSDLAFEMFTWTCGKVDNRCCEKPQISGVLGESRSVI